MITAKHDPDTYARYLKYRAEGMTARDAARRAVAERPQPTAEAVAELQKAYDFFNAELFAGTLPPTMLTMQRSQSVHGVVFGYFRPHGFKNNRNDKRTVDEISVNPAVLSGSPTLENLQTMVHEQCHQWQFRFGKPSRKTYHNREFAGKMKEIGLQPSSIGQPGGAETGQTMADYPIPGGKFLAACDKLLASGFVFSWGSNAPVQPKPAPAAGNAASGDGVKENEGGKAGKKVKYTCPKCNARAWGKSTLNLVCGECNVKMEPPASAVGAVMQQAAAMISAFLGLADAGKGDTPEPSTAAAGLAKTA
jgi:predicted SprT family Zn-dependent metalloprotease